MDARIDPAASLGIAEGDAHIIRNAGGRASDAVSVLPNLIVRMLGTPVAHEHYKFTVEVCCDLSATSWNQGNPRLPPHGMRNA